RFSRDWSSDVCSSDLEIINIFKLTASLMELHEENPFKIRTYQNAVFNLDKISSDLAALSLEELAALEGVGKSIAGKIQDLNATEIGRASCRERVMNVL